MTSSLYKSAANSGLRYNRSQNDQPPGRCGRRIRFIPAGNSAARGQQYGSIGRHGGVRSRSRYRVLLRCSAPPQRRAASSVENGGPTGRTSGRQAVSTYDTWIDGDRSGTELLRTGATIDCGGGRGG